MNPETKKYAPKINKIIEVIARESKDDALSALAAFMMLFELDVDEIEYFVKNHEDDKVLNKMFEMAVESQAAGIKVDFLGDLS